jgi:hypothetical protein
MLFLNGVYVDSAGLSTRFHWVKAPTNSELNQLSHTITIAWPGIWNARVCWSEMPSTALWHSITQMKSRWISCGGTPLPIVSRRGLNKGTRYSRCKHSPGLKSTSVAGQAAGFSLHAGVAVKANERDKLERLCHYITRPAVSEKRLSQTKDGDVRYELKTPYRDGTTHVIFEPVDLIAKLVALVPRPRVNLTRFNGVSATNSKHCAVVTAAS